MNQKIKGNFEVTTALHSYVEEKIFKRLDKFTSHVEDVTVNLLLEGGKQKYRVVVLVKPAKSKRVNTVSVAAMDMYEAIDQVADKVHRQVTKEKEKWAQRHEHRVHSGEALAFENDPKQNWNMASVHEVDNEQFEIVKVKTFSMKPMFIEDAILQMEKLGHQFFFYLDASTEQPTVVYKRKDGCYGIIESDM